MTVERISFQGPVNLGLLAILVFVFGFGSWAFMARLDGAVMVGGQIVVLGNRQIVQHPDGGLVKEVLVREGSRVAEGDPLLRLDGSDLEAELRIVEGHHANLVAKRSRLEAERDGAATIAFPDDYMERAVRDRTLATFADGQTELFELRLDRFSAELALYSERIEQLRLRKAALSEQVRAATKQLGLVEGALIDRVALFQKGLVAQDSVLSLSREVQGLRGQIAELSASESQTVGQIVETEIQIDDLYAERHEEAAEGLREIEPQLRDLEETRTTLMRRLELLIVRAPVAGIVLGLQVPKPNVVLQPAAPLLSLVPTEEPMMILAQLRPEDIDAAYLGQRAEFAISSFASEAAPRLQATVSMIGADAQLDPETKAPFFTLELTIDPGEIERLGDKHLMPGMRVEVFLTAGARSPMAYLLEPFTSFFSRALRES